MDISSGSSGNVHEQVIVKSVADVFLRWRCPHRSVGGSPALRPTPPRLRRTGEKQEIGNGEETGGQSM